MSEPKTDKRPLKVRARRACRGLRAWRAWKETHGTKETRTAPAALTARAKQERRRNDKKRSRAVRESDGYIAPSGKAASPEAGEGAHRATQSAQATSTVRTTEQDWQTFLRAIAEKACTNKHHRFGDLYRWLNQDVLRLCFYRLRKDAASGVDRVTLSGL